MMFWEVYLIIAVLLVCLTSFACGWWRTDEPIAPMLVFSIFWPFAIGMALLVLPFWLVFKLDEWLSPTPPAGPGR